MLSPLAQRLSGTAKALSPSSGSFLYAKPLPAKEFEAYLRTRRLALLFTDDRDPGGRRPIELERGAAKSSGRRRSSRS
jgi:hypothetical protein